MWLGPGEKGFDQLFQCYNKTKGMNVLKWIHKVDVTPYKKVTYPLYMAAYIPYNDDPHITQITSWGDNLDYDGDMTTHSSGMETININCNSILSTISDKYCTRNISNMHLEYGLPSLHYVCFRYDQIPPKIRTDYNMYQYVVDVYVCASIDEA